MRILLQTACLLLLATWWVGCGQTRAYRHKATDTTSHRSEMRETSGDPLLLEDEPLLLLNDVTENADQHYDAVDNSRCAVCHVNLIEEELALSHARAGIGCADCHGQSDAHIADESWASGGNGTAPDILFTKAQINPSCLECHEALPEETEHDLALLSGSNPTEFCTDCHGEHQMVNRKCSWK